MLERLGKSICKTDDCEVFALMESDVNSKRVAVSLILKYKDGSLTKPHSIPRKDIIAKRNCLDNYFFDIKGNFSHGDVITMKDALNKMVGSLDSNDYSQGQEEATLEEIKERIYYFIRDNKDKRQDVFIKGNYGCMETKVLDEFLKQNKDLKHSRVDILRWLKIMGLLQISKGRPYDYLESVNGTKKRVYKIDLSDEIELFGDISEEATIVEESITVEETTIVEEATPVEETVVSETKEESEVTEYGHQTV